MSIPFRFSDGLDHNWTQIPAEPGPHPQGCRRRLVEPEQHRPKHQL